MVKVDAVDLSKLHRKILRKFTSEKHFLRKGKELNELFLENLQLDTVSFIA